MVRVGYKAKAWQQRISMDEHNTEGIAVDEKSGCSDEAHPICGLLVLSVFQSAKNRDQVDTAFSQVNFQ